jgi:hypothetical protein
MPQAQYTPGEPCVQCRRPLSRYNPYAVCGPCRVKLMPTLSLNAALAAHAAAETGTEEWDRFPRRKRVSSVGVDA